MKKLIFLLPLFLIYACKTQTGTILTSEEKTMKDIKGQTTACPEDGTCETKLFTGKNLEIIDDGNGNLYPEIVDGKNWVVEFTYLRKGPVGTADGNYFEVITFEIPANIQTLVKENAGLADVKMIFGKHGYRMSEHQLITDGKLSLQKRDMGVHFDLRFNIGQTSHVISHINKTVRKH